MSNLTFHTSNVVIKTFTRTLCRVHGEDQLNKVPSSGPLIVMINHINFMEAPLLFTHLQPRPVTALAKTESWDFPLQAWLFDLWKIIPIRRGEADRGAVQKTIEALAEGKIVAVAPEGTRSGTGQLGPGYPGIVLLALRSGAPVLPLAFYGNENFWHNMHRLRRTDFHITVGQPFRVTDHGQALSRDVRMKITDEMMFQLAALLPTSHRGHYADLSRASENYLCFENGSHSNLPHK